MFKSEFLLIPFAMRNVAYFANSAVTHGYADYYIFGIRVARIQKTVPW